MGILARLSMLCITVSLLSGVAAAATTVRVLSPPVFSVLPFYWMQQAGLPAGIQVDVELSPDHTRSLSLLETGHCEFLVTGLNVGAKAYNKGIKLQLVNVNAWTLDYVVSRVPAPNGWRDLVGKKIALPLPGGPLDFLVPAQIVHEKLDLDKFNFVYAQTPQAIQFFNLGQVDAVVIPEPAVTQLLAANAAARLVIDIQEDWGKWHNGDAVIPYVGLFVNSSWADKNPATSLAIANAYNQGIAWMNANPAAAAKLGAKVLNLPEAVVAQALQRIKLDVPSPAELKRLVNMHLQEMLAYDSVLVGGKLPAASFFR